MEILEQNSRLIRKFARTITGRCAICNFLPFFQILARKNNKKTFHYEILLTQGKRRIVANSLQFFAQFFENFRQLFAVFDNFFASIKSRELLSSVFLLLPSSSLCGHITKVCASSCSCSCDQLQFQRIHESAGFSFTKSLLNMARSTCRFHPFLSVLFFFLFKFLVFKVIMFYYF